MSSKGQHEPRNVEPLLTLACTISSGWPSGPPGKFTTTVGLYNNIHNYCVMISRFLLAITLNTTSMHLETHEKLIPTWRGCASVGFKPTTTIRTGTHYSTRLPKWEVSLGRPVRVSFSTSGTTAALVLFILWTWLLSTCTLRPSKVHEVPSNHWRPLLTHGQRSGLGAPHTPPGTNQSNSLQVFFRISLRLSWSDLRRRQWTGP